MLFWKKAKNVIHPPPTTTYILHIGRVCSEKKIPHGIFREMTKITSFLFKFVHQIQCPFVMNASWVFFCSDSEKHSSSSRHLLCRLLEFYCVENHFRKVILGGVRIFIVNLNSSIIF